MSDQQTFRFQPGPESKQQRCQRLLASLGSTKITTANDGNLFTEAAQRAAEKLVKGAEQC